MNGFLSVNKIFPLTNSKIIFKINVITHPVKPNIMKSGDIILEYL